MEYFDLTSPLADIVVMSESGYKDIVFSKIEQIENLSKLIIVNNKEATWIKNDNIEIIQTANINPVRLIFR